MHQLTGVFLNLISKNTFPIFPFGQLKRIEEVVCLKYLALGIQNSFTQTFILFLWRQFSAAGKKPETAQELSNYEQNFKGRKIILYSQPNLQTLSLTVKGRYIQNLFLQLSAMCVCVCVCVRPSIFLLHRERFYFIGKDECVSGITSSAWPQQYGIYLIKQKKSN